jgi:hypothetical protein
MRRFEIGIFELILYSECIYADVSCLSMWNMCCWRIGLNLWSNQFSCSLSPTSIVQESSLDNLHNHKVIFTSWYLTQQSLERSHQMCFLSFERCYYRTPFQLCVFMFKKFCNNSMFGVCKESHLAILMSSSPWHFQYGNIPFACFHFNSERVLPL